VSLISPGNSVYWKKLSQTKYKLEIWVTELAMRLTIVWNVTPCSLEDTSTDVSEELSASSVRVAEFGTSVED